MRAPSIAVRGWALRSSIRRIGMSRFHAWLSDSSVSCVQLFVDVVILDDGFELEGEW